MHVIEESDESIVPSTLANKDDSESSEESAEGRDSANGNAEQAALPRTPSRDKSKSRGLLGVREAARQRFRARLAARAV